MPHSVWWITNHSLVPSSLCEMTSDRIASSLARPPAFRITWASPSLSPAYFAGSSLRVHAGEDREVASRGEPELRACPKVRGVLGVRRENLVEDTHQLLLSSIGHRFLAF